MKKLFFILSAAVMMTACQSEEEQLKQRAAELCQFIPDHELLERSADYMTADFYAVLDTMFYRLPAHEAMDHEWLYYFVTGNGGTIADYEVEKVEQVDDNHAIATILVRQKWEDGSFDPDSDIEHHQLLMERVNGVWLMADFDDHKADCISYIANNRREQARRDAISDYLVGEIGTLYTTGDLCIPTLMIVAEEAPETGSEATQLCTIVYGDFWLYWYTLSGDTLRTVSGGNHAGRMTLTMQGETPIVTAFEQTEDGARNEASARRIFGKYFELYESMHANENVREAVRHEQLSEYVHRHNLSVRYYQDYGRPAVEL